MKWVGEHSTDVQEQYTENDKILLKEVKEIINREINGVHRSEDSILSFSQFSPNWYIDPYLFKFICKYTGSRIDKTTLLKSTKLEDICFQNSKIYPNQNFKALMSLH